MKKLTFSLFVIPIFYIGTGTGTAQAQLRHNQLQPKTFSLMGQIFGPELVGLYLKYNISNMLAAHAGVGLLGDYHLGMNFYFATNRDGDMSVYLGPQLISVKDYQHGLLSANDPGYTERQFGFHAPVGLEISGRRGFTLQLEAGPSYVKKNYEQLNTKGFLFSIRLGHTFLRKY